MQRYEHLGPSAFMAPHHGGEFVKVEDLLGWIELQRATDNPRHPKLRNLLDDLAAELR